MITTAKSKRSKLKLSKAATSTEFRESLRSAALAEPDERLREWIFRLLDGDECEQTECKSPRG